MKCSYGRKEKIKQARQHAAKHCFREGKNNQGRKKEKEKPGDIFCIAVWIIFKMGWFRRCKLEAVWIGDPGSLSRYNLVILFIRSYPISSPFSPSLPLSPSLMLDSPFILALHFHHTVVWALSLPPYPGLRHPLGSFDSQQLYFAQLLDMTAGPVNRGADGCRWVCDRLEVGGWSRSGALWFSSLLNHTDTSLSVEDCIAKKWFQQSLTTSVLLTQSDTAAASSYQKVTGSIPGKAKVSSRKTMCSWWTLAAAATITAGMWVRPDEWDAIAKHSESLQITCQAIHEEKSIDHFLFCRHAGSKICTLACPPDESAMACLMQQGALQKYFPGRGYAAQQSAKLSSLYKYNISCFSTMWKLQESLGVL